MTLQNKFGIQRNGLVAASISRSTAAVPIDSESVNDPAGTSESTEKKDDCLICYESFDEGDRIKVTIDRFHDICRICLKALKDSGETRCPFRCESVVLPELVSSSSSPSDTYLEIAYEIGRFIQAFVTDNREDGSKKPWSNYQGYFSSGPNPYYYQTRQGLMLEAYYGMPSKILTPYGEWSILGCGSGNWEEVIEMIKRPLGLVVIMERQDTQIGSFGPRWAITSWKGQDLEFPEFKRRDTYISYSRVRGIWNDFVLKHPDINSKSTARY